MKEWKNKLLLDESIKTLLKCVGAHALIALGKYNL